MSSQNRTTEGPSSDNDTFYGGQGEDTLIGTSGSDALYGGTQDDLIIALERFDGAPYAPDRLFGGWGEDELVGDDGDTLTGGAGEDVFVPVVYHTDGAKSVVIEDFEPGERIQIQIYEAGFLADDGSDTFAFDDSAEGTVIRVNGLEMALVHGIQAADLALEIVEVVDVSA